MAHVTSPLGIVTEDRKKKLAFNSVKTEFHNIKKEMMNINGLQIRSNA
ncbi:MAG: hypothetical protein GX640_04785 [Fibrobacter sp.]|nr:hypothetical protein [Fibrobacter sp.]